jgi:hypothetical protein
MLLEHPVSCPWCWETIDLFVDVSAGNQSYVEDCSVCCRPILIRIDCPDQNSESVSVSVDRE